MEISSASVKKIIAWELILGGIICGVIFCVKIGTANILYNIIPSAIIFALLLFMIGSGIAYLSKTNSSRREHCLSIALILQTVHFSIRGVNYLIFFGPYLGLDLYLDPAVEFNFELLFLAFQFSLGYGRVGGETLMVGINLIPVLVLALISYLDKKERKQREDETLLRH